MVSRRNFLAITAMMLVICFLFLLPQQVKDESNPYYVNSYAQPDVKLSDSDQWHQPKIHTAEDLLAYLNSGVSSDDGVTYEKSYMMFVGDPSGSVGQAVTMWATMSKTCLLQFSDVSKALKFGGEKPAVIFVDPDACDFTKDTNQLAQWNDDGIGLVFCKLPSVQDIETMTSLQELLGIREVTEPSVELESIHLFANFLLGGERIYEEDSDLMDMEHIAPWFHLTKGNEVYMVGELSEEILPDQDYRYQMVPPLLWRHSRNGINVFVVNGDYISGSLGIGFLSAIVAENSSYYIYPVVNAQILTIANFPSMTEENTDTITMRYGKGMTAVVRDLLWPSLESMSEVCGYPMSCFFSPQYDYQDKQEPNAGLIEYYLKLIKERNAEAGLSLVSNQTVSVAEKLEKDTEFLNRDPHPYRYCAAYIVQDDLNDFQKLKNDDLISVSVKENGKFFEYAEGKTLYQYVTQNLLEYTYSSDLQLLSQQTGLAYSNALLDMQHVTWPEEGEAGWEVYYERSVSSLRTYWRPFSKFDKLTISQSDMKLRRFLNMDFAQKRQDNLISLRIEPFDGEAEFILRTHMEDVTSVSGGSFVKLEKNAWLIRAEQPNIQIVLERNSLYTANQKR